MAPVARGAFGWGLRLAVLAALGDARADWWRPVPGTSWQIQYSGALNTAARAQAYDVDLFDTPAATIARLHRKGKRVICYFSAGSREDWRPDAAGFPETAIGKPLEGWPGERWLDVRRLDGLLPIVQGRIALAAAKGCDAVDPDNVDGYANDTGFPLAYADQLRFNRAVAEAAHAAGLAVGLKNDLGQIPDLLAWVDFAVNEECFEYGECGALRPFVAAGKAVFGIEYRLPASRFCRQARALNFDFLRKRRDLGAWRKACR